MGVGSAYEFIAFPGHERSGVHEVPLVVTVVALTAMRVGSAARMPVVVERQSVWLAHHFARVRATHRSFVSISRSAHYGGRVFVL